MKAKVAAKDAEIELLQYRFAEMAQLLADKDVERCELLIANFKLENPDSAEPETPELEKSCLQSVLSQTHRDRFYEDAPLLEEVGKILSAEADD